VFGKGPSAAGSYIVQFVGQAVILPQLMGNTTISGQVYDAATDTTNAVMNVPAIGLNGCNCVMLNFANASTKGGVPGLKDIMVLQPGHTLAEAGGFTHQFMSMVSRFRPLRFMDWTHTNNNKQVEWSERTQYNAYSYAAENGYPWELVAKLCNLQQTACWINIPARASDDYIRQLATLMADPKVGISSDVTLYLEYSNEVWNFGFQQFGYNVAEANASVYNDSDPYYFNGTKPGQTTPAGWSGQGTSNVWSWAQFRVALKTIQIAKAFKAAFGAADVGRGKRIRPVFAWQCGNGHDDAMDYVNRTWGNPSDFFDATAIAPYFNIGPATNNPKLTVDEVVAGWTETVANQTLSGPSGLGGTNFVAEVAATCGYWGLSCHGYEGGPDTVGGNTSDCASCPLAAKANASVDRRIGPIITHYLQDWYSYGEMMGPLNHYSASASSQMDQYGIYSLTWDMAVQTTPKITGIDAARATTPATSNKIPVLPLVGFNASYFTGHTIPVKTGWTGAPFFGTPHKMRWLVRAPTAGKYLITAYTGNDGSGNVTGHVSVGGAVPQQQTFECPKSGAWTRLAKCGSSAPFAFAEGVNVIQILNEVGWIGQLDVALL
jgi:hypothetical protein